MRRAFIATVFGLRCMAAAAAGETPPVTLTSTPLELARAAIGDRRGAVSIGLWRDGKASFAGLRDGAIVPAEEVGGANAALFEIGSISKVFTGVLLAQAVERGELSLDDTLGRLLEGKVTFASEKVAAVTLRQLVTHTACLPRLPANLLEGANARDPYAHYDRAELWNALATQQVMGTPPCDAAYSNLGVGLLGDLLALRHGRSWEALVHERITAPLGMRDTLVTLGDKAPRLAPGFSGTKSASTWSFDALVGAGGLRSTPADMLIFGRAILAGRNGPLGAAAERVVTPLARFGDGAIGHAMQLRGPADKRSFSHDGATGGYRSVLLLAADTGEVLVVLAGNADAPVGRLAAELAAARYPVEAVAPGAPANCLVECAGVYRFDPRAALTFVVQDAAMHVHATGRPFDRLTPGGTDAFSFGTVSRFVFERDAAGKPLAVQMTSRGETRRATRSDEPLPARATTPNAEAFAGRYTLSPTLTFDVRASAGQLTAQLGAQPRLAVYAVTGQPDRFAYDVVEAALQFERDASGKVVALALHQNGQHRAPKTD